tara:strand:- start:3 stop:1187 length:1185 start_codon:yes stop_codon:yes gene_type:complete
MAKKAAVKTKEKVETISEEVIIKDLGLEDELTDKTTDTELDKKANEAIDQLLSEDLSEIDKRNAVDKMGSDTQEEVTRLSTMLDAPIKEMAKNGDNGGPVADALLDLKSEIEELDPAKFDFSSASGFLASLARFLPWGAKPISRYFSKFMSAEDVINKIIESLKDGKKQLERDNITLGTDKERMIAAMGKLKKAIQLAKKMDEKLQYKLDREVKADDPQRKFIEEELLFPLRQRIMDLQQTLNVNQQSILTIEVIIRNNRELIRGVDRALNVTVTALQIAVACALALNNQEIVLQKIDALNTTTSNLIKHNAERLKTQGVEIHKKAADANISIEDLQQAFNDINLALEGISKFRSEALPKMAKNIELMSNLNTKAGESVAEMEKGSKAKIKIDV